MERKLCLAFVVLFTLLFPVFAGDGVENFCNEIVFNPASGDFIVLGFSLSEGVPEDESSESELPVNSYFNEGKLYGRAEVYAYWWIVGKNGGTLSVSQDSSYLLNGNIESDVEWSISDDGSWTRSVSDGIDQLSTVISGSDSGYHKITVDTGPVEAVATDTSYIGRLVLTYAGK